jgi:hypothetical protein
METDMPIESVAAVPAMSGYPSVTRVSRPPEVTPDAQEIARQENDARRIAESVSGASPAYLSGPEGQSVAVGGGTRTNIVAVPAEPQGALENAKAEISRAYSEGETTPADLRNAAEAYRAEAAARDELARREQQGGVRSLDVLV